jgi:excisionase family DNA binding protein
VVDLLSLADVARLLGVSVERARQLVIGGQLPGRRFGNAWVVPKDAVDARRHSPGAHGRPLGPVRAWHEIVSGTIDVEHPGRYQRRARVLRGSMSRADIMALPGLLGARVSGAEAARALGEQLSGDDPVDLYVAADSLDELHENVAFVADPLGNVSLRIVEAAAWNLLGPAHLAPRGAVALDLLESGDPRRWIAAERLVAADG